MRRLIRGFGYAFKGMGYAFSTQLNIRIHIILTAVALILGLSLHVSTPDWLWLLLCIALVLSAELLNTAIETLTDLVSPGYHEKAGRVKDIAAAAVTVTAAFALVTGCIIFLPKIILLFK
ncbi:diacylglycerol kinase family protein [Mucilaginibacter paludis]|uniref:Diacylglycerol kinase n=1 Tax=Mucilaginibacter paludis DSM 18603 TaxID=714943 RepID=H1YC10_9SPHI|nr:diacylglycerol kinase family protein [Mucilaginibacter paludis]EHQ27088.1 diacylglycerol kinase [Mucilaginibacter paludis DSM 18603]